MQITIKHLGNSDRELHLVKQHGYFIVEGVEFENGTEYHTWYDCYDSLAVANTAFNLYENWVATGDYPVVPDKLAYARR